MNTVATNNKTKQLIIILIIGFAYAITRYVLSGSVSPHNIPVYIANKVLSVSAVFTLMLSAIAYLKDNNEGARDWGRISFHLMVLHVMFSLVLFSSEYYGGMFYYWGDEYTNRLTIKGELSTVFGLLGAYTYYLLFMSKHNTQRMAYLKLATTFFVGSHLFVMAYTGWLPWTWGPKFHMPPISLLSFIFTGIAFLIYLKMKDAKRAAA